MVWLEAWQNRRKITIDNTKIDGVLTDFPLAVAIAASVGLTGEDLSSIFTDLGANSKKIAIATAGGTELPVEIERWSTAGTLALLHTKVPTVMAGTDTELYLYWDSDRSDNPNVGTIGSTIAQTVWDSDFEAVWHFTSSSVLTDSTSNGNNGSMTASSVGDSPFGRAAFFDGTNDYGRTSGTAVRSVLATKSSDYTVETRFNSDAGSDGGMLLNIMANNFFDEIRFRIADNGIFYVYDDDPTAVIASITGDYRNAYQYVSAVVGFSDIVLRRNYDAGTDTADVSALGNLSVANNVAIGERYAASNGHQSSGYWGYFDGFIDETRISTTARSDAWLKATYNTLSDTLLTFGSPEIFSTSWLGSYLYRRKFTIAASLVSSNLTNFPLSFAIGASVGLGGDDLSDVFTACTDSDCRKLSITTADGITECFVEIERWTSASTLGMLHAKIPYISSMNDTDIYLYYGSDNNNVRVGVTGSTSAASVWDSNYVSVWHLAQDPSGGANSILDSTSNGINGTPGGSMTSGDLVDGISTGKALDFEGTDDEITFGADSAFNVGTGDMTIDALFNGDVSATHVATRIAYGSGEANDHQAAGIYPANDVTNRLEYRDSSGAVKQIDPVGAHANWYFISAVRDTQTVKGYQNGVSAGTDVSGANHDHSSHVRTRIGANSDTVADSFFDGKIGEIRYSDVARSSAWHKATYESLFDTFGTWSDTENITGVWLGTYAYRRKFTVGASVNASTLTDFPVALHIGSAVGKLGGRAGSDLSGTLAASTGLTDSNSRKLAVTTSNGTTECFVEIERWTSASTLAMLHFRAPVVNGGTNTVFYLYWDNAASSNAKAGVTGSTSAASVWSNEFVHVWHMNQISGGVMTESSKQGADATAIAMDQASNRVDSTGSAFGMDFDGTAEKFTFSNGFSGFTESMTHEVIFKADVVNAEIFLRQDNLNNQDFYHFGLYDSIYFNSRRSDDSTTDIASDPFSDTASFHYLAGYYDGTDIGVALDGATVAATEAHPNMTSISSQRQIGDIGSNNIVSSNFFNGIISELRSSNTLRSYGWQRSTYHTLFDTYGFWAATESFTGGTGGTGATGATPPPTGAFGEIAINGSWKSVDSCYISISEVRKISNKMYIAINNQWKLVT